MFDDIPSKNSAAPTNLPIGEPEDIFLSTPVAASDKVNTYDTPPVVNKRPSALESGMLRAKKEDGFGGADSGLETSYSEAPREPKFQTPPAMPPEVDTPPQKNVYRVKGPIFSRGLLAVVIVVVAVGGVAGAAWFGYQKLSGPKENADNLNSPVPEDNSLNGVGSEDLNQDTGIEVVDEVTDESLLYGMVPDTDGDGLDDIRERELGTDSKNWDADGDELGDYDEVVSWKTDPLKRDTDGDGFIDGQEVKHGYNPTGPGKIFQPPTPEVSGEANSSEPTLESLAE